jgi:hypothetical protein
MKSIILLSVFGTGIDMQAAPIYLRIEHLFCTLFFSILKVAEFNRFLMVKLGRVLYAPDNSLKSKK